MGLGKHTVWVLGIFLLGSLDIWAQSPHIRLSFRRQNNFSYNTQAGVDYTLTNKNYQLDLELSHDNILNRSRKKDQFVQAFLHGSIWQYVQLSPQLKLASWIEYDHFFNNNNFRLSSYGGVTYTPNPNITITPLVGFSWDQRSMILDQGFSPALRLDTRYTWDDGLRMQTQLFARTKQISPRNQRNISLRSIWTRSFSTFADLAFQLQAGSREIDDYRSNMIERILSDTLNPTLNLRYQFQPNLYWDSENSFSLTRRQFVFEIQGDNPVTRNDLSFGQLDVFSRQKLSWGNKRFRGYIQYQYQTLNRRYELENTLDLAPNAFEQQLNREKQKDFFRELNQLELQLSYQVHPRHTLRLNANNRYLQYDTPADNNFDDHDELTYGLSTEWQARWSRSFSTSSKILGNVRKYAFLLKERSQDNYTQYSLRAEFNYRWEPLKRLTINGKQYVYVAYNIKDFEDFNRTDRSTRNLESHLTMKSQPKRNWEIDFTLYRRETHVSYIIWDTFTETTLDTTITYNLSNIHTFSLKSPWENIRMFLDIGYQHLSLTRRFNTSMTNLENILVPINLRTRSLQSGPRTGFKLFRRNPASIQFNVWWQLQYLDNTFREIESFTSLSASLREEALRQITRNFRPFFDLRLNFWLP